MKNSIGRVSHPSLSVQILNKYYPLSTFSIFIIITWYLKTYQGSFTLKTELYAGEGGNHSQLTTHLKDSQLDFLFPSPYLNNFH